MHADAADFLGYAGEVVFCIVIACLSYHAMVGV